MKKILVVVVFSFLGLISSCSQNELDDLRLENAQLKEIIENSIVILNNNSIRNKFTPITISRQTDYMVGDTINIFGLLGIMDVKNISLEVVLDQRDTIIKADDSFYWEYDIVANKIGADTLSGVYLLNVKDKKIEMRFEHILNIQEE